MDSFYISAHQLSLELETLLRKVSPNDFSKQGEIRYDLCNKIENVCLRLCAEHNNQKEKIMFFKNTYASIGKNVDELIQTNGEDFVKKLIIDLKKLLKGCGYNV